MKYFIPAMCRVNAHYETNDFCKHRPKSIEISSKQITELYRSMPCVYLFLTQEKAWEYAGFIGNLQETAYKIKKIVDAPRSRWATLFGWDHVEENLVPIVFEVEGPEPDTLKHNQMLLTAQTISIRDGQVSNPLIPLFSENPNNGDKAFYLSEKEDLLKLTCAHDGYDRIVYPIKEAEPTLKHG